MIQTITQNDSLYRVCRRLFFYITFCLAIPFLSLLAATIIYYFPLTGKSFQLILASFFLIWTILTFLISKNFRRSLDQFCAVVFLLIILWFSVRPSLDRNWNDSVAKLAQADIKNSTLTLKNVRNFHYNSATDYQMNYYNESYDLDKIEGTDFLISHWNNVQTMAHTFFSFRLKDGKVICISVEVRKEKGEKFNPIHGLFKQYELAYVIGDEKDLIGLRTKHLQEELYLYPTRLTTEESKTLLLSMLQEANSLHLKPKFYNTLSLNCTTALIDHLNILPSFNLERHPKVLLNGLSDQLAYRKGFISNKKPFTSLKQSAYISEICLKTKLDIHFSQNIRHK